MREAGRREVRQPSRPQLEEVGTGEGRGRGVHGAFWFLTTWCRSTWLSASQAAGGGGRQVRGAPAPPRTSHLTQGLPTSHRPHQDGKPKPRDAPCVAVDGMADVLEAALGRR